MLLPRSTIPCGHPVEAEITNECACGINEPLRLEYDGVTEELVVVVMDNEAHLVKA